jgi:hypothetical protein
MILEIWTNLQMAIFWFWYEAQLETDGHFAVMRSRSYPDCFGSRDNMIGMRRDGASSQTLAPEWVALCQLGLRQ